MMRLRKKCGVEGSWSWREDEVEEKRRKKEKKRREEGIEVRIVKVKVQVTFDTLQTEVTPPQGLELGRHEGAILHH